MPPSDPNPSETSPLGRLLYVSSLAPKVPATELSRIAAVSRVRNAEDAITGLLAFDGASFCQYVEGPSQAVEALLGRLERDPRHDHMQILLDGTAPGERRFSDWRTGYVDSFEGDELSALRSLEGTVALARLESLLPRLDIEV